MASGHDAGRVAYALHAVLRPATHRRGLFRYKGCVTGCEVVAGLIALHFSASQEQAIALGSELIQLGFLAHVQDARKPLKNKESALYRLVTWESGASAWGAAAARTPPTTRVERTHSVRSDASSGRSIWSALSRRGSARSTSFSFSDTAVAGGGGTEQPGRGATLDTSSMTPAWNRGTGVGMGTCQVQPQLLSASAIPSRARVVEPSGRLDFDAMATPTIDAARVPYPPAPPLASLSPSRGRTSIASTLGWGAASVVSSPRSAGGSVLSARLSAAELDLASSSSVSASAQRSSRLSSVQQQSQAEQVDEDVIDGVGIADGCAREFIGLAERRDSASTLNAASSICTGDAADRATVSSFDDALQTGAARSLDTSVGAHGEWRAGAVCMPSPPQTGGGGAMQPQEPAHARQGGSTQPPGCAFPSSPSLDAQAVGQAVASAILPLTLQLAAAAHEMTALANRVSTMQASTDAHLRQLGARVARVEGAGADGGARTVRTDGSSLAPTLTAAAAAAGAGAAPPADKKEQPLVITPNQVMLIALGTLFVFTLVLFGILMALRPGAHASGSSAGSIQDDSVGRATPDTMFGFALSFDGLRMLTVVLIVCVSAFLGRHWQ